MEWGQQTGSEYPDREVARTIIENASRDSAMIYTAVGEFVDTASVNYKYFATPIMWQDEKE